MTGLLALRAFRFALIFAVAVGAVLCSDRLFGILGMESALALGALLPPWAAAVGARLVTTRARNNETASAAQLLQRALAGAWLIVLAPTALLALNGLRVRNCSPWQGVLFILLGPVAASTLASIWGVFVATLTSRPRVGVSLALLGPLGTIAIALGHFHTTPAIFAYGHFFGFFPGTLYDEALQIPGPLWTLRAVTLAYAVGLACLVVGHLDPLTRRLRLQPRGSSLFGLVAMLGLGITFAAEIDAVTLGHRTSVDWIAARLGRTLEGERCRVVVPRELRRDEAERLLEDCDFRVDQMERVIGVTQRGRVTAFFFRSPDEKRMLMGAATTSIAKPWRNEIYVQLNGWPHPSLAHEIAHVVAGNLAPGPFHVAARFGGLWPEAALIEGMAVAAAWDADDGMTPHQWARAMVELGLSPRVSDLLGTGFLRQPKERAYTLAGSFLRFVRDAIGADALRQIYRTGRPDSPGMTLGDLEAQWLAFVQTVPLPASAAALAAHRFERGSIFAAVCPHEVANLRVAVHGDLAANDTSAAITSCGALLAVDGTDAWARAALVSTLARAGRLSEATRELDHLSRLRTAGDATVWAAKHAVADAAWRADDVAGARLIYGELLHEAQPEDAARLLEVKRLAVTSPPSERRLFLELLVGRDGSVADGATAVHLARELAAVRVDGLGAYLEARQLFIAQRFDLSASLMLRSRSLGLPTALLRAAALRLEAISRYVQGEITRSSQLWTSVASLTDGSHAAEAADWHARARWRASRLHSRTARAGIDHP